MKIEVVPVERIPAMWGDVGGWLTAALLYTDDYSIDHVQVYLVSGQWMLVVATDERGIHGAAAVQFFNRPTGRVAFIVAMGGKLVTGADAYAQLRAILKTYGATHIEGASRDVAARLWERFGLTEKYRVMGAKL